MLDDRVIDGHYDGTMLYRINFLEAYVKLFREVIMPTLYLYGKET